MWNNILDALLRSVPNLTDDTFYTDNPKPKFSFLHLIFTLKINPEEYYMKEMQDSHSIHNYTNKYHL